MIIIGERRNSCNACGADTTLDKKNIDAREIKFGYNGSALVVSLCKECRERAIIVLQAMGVDSNE